MKNVLLLAISIISAGAVSAQNYITPAPDGGFNVAAGKDYVVLYAPEQVIDVMGDRLISDNNLDQDKVDNYLEYWVTDWDKKDLTLYNVPAEEGELNSFGTDEFINATPLYAWGTGVFMSVAKPYDLSKVTTAHHLHIGLRDFGSAPSKYQFSVGSQKTIKTNGFQVMVGIGLGQTSGDFVGVGTMPNANDGKWYYLDIPVADMVDANGEFGFEFDFSQPISDGVFTFSFNSPTCSTAKKSGPAPGDDVYTYEITKLGSALSLDHVFFYIPDANGIEDIVIGAEDAAPVYYDMMGRRVDNPLKGIFIEKTANGVRKVVK